MAMPPAAKDPNTFASHNLSGGNSATGAVMGIPQDVSAPRGPQPQSLPQGMPGGVPNFFAAPQGGAQPQPQALQVPGLGDYNQVTAQNQAVIAQMFQPKQDQAPQYGINAAGDLQVGDQVVPMSRNPTMAAQAIASPAGKQSVSSFLPGFQPVDSRDIQQHLASVNPGFFNSAAELGRRAAAGATTGFIHGVGSAMQQVGLEGLGQGEHDFADYISKNTRLGDTPDTLGHSSLFNAAGNFAEGAGSFAPYMALGEIAAPIKGLQIAANAAGAVIPSLAAGQETQQKLLAAGASEQDASTAGWKTVLAAGVGNAALMGGGMALTGANGGSAVAKGIYSLQRAVGAKQLTIDQAVAQATNPAFWARFGKATAADAALQATAMGGQGAAIANIENNASPTALPDNDPFQKGLEGAASGVAFAGLLSPRGAYHQWGDSARRAQLGRDLSTPATSVDLLSAVRMDQAAKAVHPEIASMLGRDKADNFVEDTQAKSTDAYASNMLAQERAARSETPGYGGQAPAEQFQPDTARQDNAAAAFSALPAESSTTSPKAAATTEDPALTPHIDALLNRVNPALLASGKARTLAADVVNSGLSADPAGERILEALSAGKLKQAQALLRIEKERLKGVNDSNTGPAGPGLAAVGESGGDKPSGSVGAGAADATGQPGGAGAGTGTTERGVPKTVAGGTGTEPAPAVKRAEIPDFSLEHPTGAPSTAWLAAHPTETPAEVKPTDNLSLKAQKETGQKTLFDPEVKRPTPKRPVVPKDAPRAAVNQGSALGPTASEVKPEVETAAKAKQSRKRQEEAAAVEAAKPPEQRAAEEAAAKAEHLPPADIWKSAFGDKPGEVIGHLIAGKTAKEAGEASGVSKATAEKALSRHGSLDRFERAEQEGKLKAYSPEDVAAARRLLEKAHEGAKVRKTAAEGGAHVDDMSGAEKADVVTQEGTQIKSSEEAVGFSDKEQNLLKRIDEIQAALKHAKAEGDAPRVEQLQRNLDAATKAFANEQLKYAVKGVKSGENTLDLEISKLRDKIQELDDAGKFAKADKLRQELAELEAARDKDTEAELEGEAGTERDYESDDEAGNSDDVRDRRSTGGGISNEELNPIIDKIVTALGGDRSMVQVHDTAEGMPPGSVAGRVDENGTVHLYRDGISSGLEGQKTLFHELFHSGLRKLGIEYHRVLNQLYRTNDRVRVLADEWVATPEGQKAKADYAAEYPNAPQDARAKLVSHATDEALARIAEELKTGTGLGTATRSGTVRAIARWMAKLADSLGMNKLAQDIRSMTYTRVEKFVQEAIEASTSRRQMEGEGARNRLVDRNVSQLPEKYQEPVRHISNTLSRWTESAINKSIFTRDLVQRGVARGLEALRTFDEHRESRDALAGHYQKMAYDAIEDVRKFSDPEKRELSDFLQQSTIDKQWGYGDKATGKAKVAFEALSPRSQKVAKAIFEHGDTILKEKKAAIQELTDSLYKGMIDDAREAGNSKAVEDLQRERDGFMKKYNTLLAIEEGNPYVSLQRRGDFVAVGKSDTYLKAEAAANAEGATRADREALEALQTNPDHYLVSSAQNEREAQLLRQNMRDAGFPATGDHTYYRPKAEWAKDGGGGVIAGMGRLRNQLDMMSRESSSPADRARYASMNHLLTNMWLDALSQRSARKAEMRRLGVHGTMDVVGSFREAAGADAHFISGIKFNDKMLTALKEARKQADRGEGEERTSNLNLLDEFLKRHEQGTSAVPTPWANKITKSVALWQIATSPAHYIGNLMQPWTMTLPYLQAKHGYAPATSEFFKAYKEIGAILADTGLLKSLKVDDMPADVRDAMKRLLELGRLDIGMNTEYTSMELNIIPKTAAGKMVDAAADRITQASLKMESLNRLASAAAAYRLELKRTGSHEKALHYAGDVVAETHGDHSRTNAPRIFNEGFGKVALQFRKFQLVQLTQMAKMVGNLRNADPAEREVALRMMFYTLSHVAALGGAIGMPGFSTFSSMAASVQKLLTGVEGEDLETRLEKMVGDRHMAQLLLRGIPGALGVDLTSKVGYGDMLGIAPYTDVNVTDRKSVVDAIGQVTSGPFGGLLGRAATSLHHIVVGNYYKGLEGLMPQGIANVFKGAREGTQGVTNTKGDKLMDLNAGEALLVALGFQPSSKALMQAETGAMIQSTAEFKDRLETLKERYTNTVKAGGDVSGDVKNMNALRAEMQARGFRPTPLGDMLKAPTQQLIRQIFTTPGGVQYRPVQTGKAVEQLPK